MLWLLVLAFFIITGTTAVITYLLYWYEEGSRPYGPHPGVHVRAASILKGLAMSFFSQCIVLCTYPFGLVTVARIPGARKLQNATQDNPPIILVHGLYHNASAWMMFRYWLKKEGFTHAYCVNYLSLGTDFDAALHKLEERLERLVSACPHTKPVLVGHSLGGLLIRAWLAIPGNQRKIQGAVTMGSPHQGSKLAGLGLGRLARSLIFRGDLIRRIEAEDVEPNVPCYSLSSSLDNMVLPQEGLHIRVTGWREERTAEVSHIAMLYHYPTAMQAIGKIREIIAETADRQQNT